MDADTQHGQHEGMVVVGASVAALVGLGLNAVFGLWWADPVAALVIAVFLVREGNEALRGGDDDD